MRSWYHSWIAAIRIARRDAWRAKGRSALVLAMITLPVLGVSAADVTLRSAELSVTQKLDREIGAADASLSSSGIGGPVHQHPEGHAHAPVGGYSSEEETPRAVADQVRSAIPAGARSLRISLGNAKVHTRHGLLPTEMREFDTADPLTEGILTLRRGRLPGAAGEVIATEAFLKESGYFVGSTLTPRGSTASYRIVGAYELPSLLGRVQVTAPPGSLLAPLDQALRSAGESGIAPEESYLVKVGGDGFTWNMVKEVNAKGVLAVSRAVALDPPADSDVPLFQQEHQHSYGYRETVRARETAVTATVIGLALLEVCLLAGPAFAVGARRSRRQLGLIAANGGDRRHIRAVVLSGGLVIGAVAAVLGTSLGILLTVALRPVLEAGFGNRFGGFELRPLEILGIALLAVVTGLLSAAVPAVTASRQTVLASLTGRRGVRRAGRVLPALGLLAVVGGTTTALYGAFAKAGTLVVMSGSALAEVGIVALTPALVGLFGRAGRLLPLSPRLALRDAVRNRGRTAPAVAAVLAAVAGTVAVATYEHSQDAQSRHAYTEKLPYGAGRLTADGPARHQDVPALRDALTRHLPVAVRADVERLVAGGPGCDPYSFDQGCGRAEVITPKNRRCPVDEAADGAASFTGEQLQELREDWRCRRNPQRAPSREVVADEKLLTVLGVTDPGTVSALTAGKAVSFDRRNVQDGKVTVRLVTDPKAAAAASARHEEPPGQDRSVAVHQAPDEVESYGITLVLPPAAARAAGLAAVPLGSYFTLDGEAGSAQLQKLDGELDQRELESELLLERGYRSETGLPVLALTLFAGLVTIGAAGIATGLSLADSEADLRTLAAVGAPPRVRRTLSGLQCGVVALMGVVLGSAAGILPAVGLRLTDRFRQESLVRTAVSNGYVPPQEMPYVPIAVPWETLGGLLIAVPLGAALLAALVTRSDGALSRRAAG